MSDAGNAQTLIVHDGGLTLSLPGAEKEIAVQFALDEQGKKLVGDLTVPSGEAVVVPIDVTWRKGAAVKASRTWAGEIIAESKKWRRARIAFFSSAVIAPEYCVLLQIPSDPAPSWRSATARGRSHSTPLLIKGSETPPVGVGRDRHRRE